VALLLSSLRLIEFALPRFIQRPQRELFGAVILYWYLASFPSDKKTGFQSMVADVFLGLIVTTPIRNSLRSASLVEATGTAGFMAGLPETEDEIDSELVADEEFDAG
jgi:hypothetical protein